jgi:hypothetical protein
VEQSGEQIAKGVDEDSHDGGMGNIVVSRKRESRAVEIGFQQSSGGKRS